MLACQPSPVVNHPNPVCILPYVPEFPEIGAHTSDGQVTVSLDDVQKLYLWVTQEEARLNKAEFCLTNRQ